MLTVMDNYTVGDKLLGGGEAHAPQTPARTPIEFYRPKYNSAATNGTIS